MMLVRTRRKFACELYTLKLQGLWACGGLAKRTEGVSCSYDGAMLSATMWFVWAQGSFVLTLSPSSYF